MENVQSSSDASDDLSCVFTSMWREHTLKRTDYPPDLNGLIRFMYAKQFMSTAVAESRCFALPLCEESVGDDLLLQQRLANGMTFSGVSFSRSKSGDLLGRSSRASVPRMFTENAKVTLTRTTLEECYKEPMRSMDEF